MCSSRRRDEDRSGGRTVMPRTAGGFTAVELAITLAIAAIFGAMALPGFVNTIRDARLTTTGEQLHTDLIIARREAIKRNSGVLVCAPGNGNNVNTCAPGNSGKWGDGRLVCYADQKSPSDCATGTTTSPNPIIHRSALDAAMALSGPSAPLRFNADGTAYVMDKTRSLATFTITGNWTGSKGYLDKVEASGNIKLCPRDEANPTTCKPGS